MPFIPYRLLTISAIVALLGTAAGWSQIVTFQDTEPLDWQGPLDEKMLDGLHVFIDRKIDASVEARSRFWSRDLSSAVNYEKSVAPNRERFRSIIGLKDERVLPSMERYGDDDNPALVAETPTFRVFQVRWPVLAGVTGEGLLLEPRRQPVGRVVAIPDADQTPEMLIGLAPGLPDEAQFARRLVESGFEVVVPLLINRAAEVSGHPDVHYTNLSHREWVYRQAFVMGRHIISYEVQKVLSVVDWFARRGGPGTEVGIAGYGEGGLIALYAAASDTRIDATLVSGYFDSRQRVWEEPLDRTVWGLLREFGDAEIATLIAPRGLVVEHSSIPTVAGPPAVPEGWRKAAAPGVLRTPDFRSVASEFNRIDSLTRPGFQPRHLVNGPSGKTVGPGSEQALAHFASLLGLTVRPSPIGKVPEDRRRNFDPKPRQHRQVKQLEKRVQELVAESGYVRDRFYMHAAMPALTEAPPSRVLSAETHSAEEFARASKKFRAHLHDEIVGRLDDPLLPAHARSRRIYEEPTWTGYEIVLDVAPDVFAWGILLVPKDIKPGEKRPVVVAQHGYNGLPKHVVEGDDPYYRNFAARLAERGFVVFAPHNFYRDTDRFRWLDKKAKMLKLTMFSFIAAQHQQILNWLSSLPFVDSKRMGFYGLSYGGTTATVVPPLLEDYALSICSANFNEDIHKLTAVDRGYSYMYHPTWEVPLFNLGNTFGNAEKAYLMIPRPFMVERGHHDGVGMDRWVAAEYAKVRRLYAQLGISDRTEIQFFNGGHTILADRTFRFLHKHLDWPEPE
jgi:dienelactone hydrolase